MSTIPEDQALGAARTDRSQWLVRKGRLGDPGFEESWPPMTPEERLALVWPLTVQIWEFQGANVAESRLPRHALCITRRALHAEHVQ